MKVASIICTLWLAGAFPAHSQEETLEQVKTELLDGNYSALERLTDIDAREALPILRASALDDRSPELSAEAMAVLQSSPGMESVIERNIVELREARKSDPNIKRNFDLLAKLGTANAARTIAQFLNDSTVLPSGMDDVTNESLDASAAVAMQQFGFSDGPTRGGARRGVTSNEVEQWKRWWEKNAPQIDELVIEARKNPAPMPTRVPAYTTTAPTPPSEPKPLPSPIAEMPQFSTPTQSEVATPERKSNFPIIPIAVIAALLVAGVVFFLRRKTP